MALASSTSATLRLSKRCNAMEKVNPNSSARIPSSDDRTPPTWDLAASFDSFVNHKPTRKPISIANTIKTNNVPAMASVLSSRKNSIMEIAPVLLLFLLNRQLPLPQPKIKRECRGYTGHQPQQDRDPAVTHIFFPRFIQHPGCEHQPAENGIQRIAGGIGIHKAGQGRRR